MEQASKEKDEQTRRELEEETRKLQEPVGKIKEDSEGLAAGYAAEKEKWEARMKGMEQDAKEERERVTAEYQRQLDNLTRHLQDQVDLSATDRSQLERKVKELQDLVGTLLRIPIFK